MMSLMSSARKYESYLAFLERKLNGCPARWYGKTKEHKTLLAEGKPLPPWRKVKIRCHDFRVTFCTMCYEAGVPVKTLQVWMGHSGRHDDHEGLCQADGGKGAAGRHETE